MSRTRKPVHPKGHVSPAAIDKRKARGAGRKAARATIRELAKAVRAKPATP